MPIEIRELQITTVVQNTPASTSADLGSSSSSSKEKDAIVAACVEQVLEILQQKNER
jgi:hypothetical protein